MIKPLLAGLFGGLFCAGAIQADDLLAIRDLKLENGRILSVERITRPYHIDKQDRKIGRIPSRIIVKLVLMPAKGSCINVEIWLPERDKWNGWFVGRGNGGAGGHINPDGFIGSIRMGFASATTDMGTAPAPDIGIGNPEVWKDFGFRSTHLMTVAAKQVIKAFYGKSPVYSYFLGHSTGGQQALQEAHNDTITLIGHSYGGDTAENAAHDTTRAIDKLITLDPVSFWDFDGSKPDSVNNWYNVIAEDDVYTWNDWIADVGGQWGEEYGAQNFVVETDHNNPLDMLNYLKGRGLLE